MGNRLHVCVTLLLVTLSLAAKSALGQQRADQVFRWGISNFQTYPDPGLAMLFDRTPVESLPWNANPSLLVFTFKVETGRSSVELLKPISTLSPGLPQMVGNASPSWDTGGWYQPPHTFDGLVQFVGAIRLNLQSAATAQEGWTWGFALGPPQNGQPNVGLSVRYKYKF